MQPDRDHDDAVRHGPHTADGLGLIISPPAVGTRAQARVTGRRPVCTGSIGSTQYADHER
ncbi:hypothetical protein GCM10009676_24540 [Prauserella halophila]|uniref:Uncharacterized protein n=1 Tax=Prauserella halophila TaxID=185641 RepID=A0ABP4GV57_9PSEU